MGISGCFGAAATLANAMMLRYDASTDISVVKVRLDQLLMSIPSVWNPVPRTFYVVGLLTTPPFTDESDS
jgi:hypothetical protein